MSDLDFETPEIEPEVKLMPEPIVHFESSDDPLETKRLAKAQGIIPPDVLALVLANKFALEMQTIGTEKGITSREYVTHAKLVQDSIKTAIPYFTSKLGTTDKAANFGDASNITSILEEWMK